MIVDPWLKKNKSSKTGSKVKEKKKKEKKKKKKKEKNDNLDDEFDKALARSGLLKKESSQTNGTSNTSKKNNVVIT